MSILWIMIIYYVLCIIYMHTTSIGVLLYIFLGNYKLPNEWVLMSYEHKQRANDKVKKKTDTVSSFWYLHYIAVLILILSSPYYSNLLVILSTMIVLYSIVMQTNSNGSSNSSS